MRNLKTHIKKFLAVTISGAVLLTGGIADGMVTARAAETNSNLKIGWFEYAPHSEGDLDDIYIYSDEWFKNPATEYNASLATMSMQLAAGSISSQKEGNLKSHNITALLEKWGFEDIRYNEYYDQPTQEDGMGVTVAHKTIKDADGKDCTLLAVVPRSAGYATEWSGNFNVGEEGLHKGFETAKNIVADFAKKYVATYKDSFKEKIKLWTVGYSRGAATTNLFGGAMADNSMETIGLHVDADDTYVYTFGTPKGVYYQNENEKKEYEVEDLNDTTSKYSNIFSVFTGYDIVTMVAFEPWGENKGFTRYGKSVDYREQAAGVTGSEEAAKQQMLAYLEKTNPVVYKIYTEQAETSNPDYFVPMKVNTENGFALTADTEAENPGQEAFLKKRFSYLTSSIVPDRTDYVKDQDETQEGCQSYQEAMRAFMQLYFSMSAGQISLFSEGASENIKVTAAMLYAYYVADQLVADKTGTELREALNQLLTILEQASQQTEESSSKELPELAKELLKDLAQMGVTIKDDAGNALTEEALEQYLKNTETENIYTKYKESLKNVTDEQIKNVADEIVAAIHEYAVESLNGTIQNGMEKAGISEEIKTRISNNKELLTKFLVYFLLGSEEEVTNAFSFDNAQMKTAATFLGNSGRYMRVHNNEIIISWLRTGDEVYAANGGTALWNKEEPVEKKTQVLKVTKQYIRTLGCKDFQLNAKITEGNGKLSYSSSDKKVAVVTSSGKVKVKGTGICTIRVKASGTSEYKSKTTKVTIKVRPKKNQITKIRVMKNRTLQVSWTKDTTSTGYQIQYSTSKKFEPKATRTVTIKKNSTTSVKLQKLKKGKQYYVRIRSYKKVKVGTKIHVLHSSSWSKRVCSGKVKE